MVSSKKIRISEDQKEKMLDFMYKHPDFAAGKFMGAKGKELRAKMWQHLASMLNADERGAFKTVEKWSRSWDDWRSKTKTKAADLHKYCQETEGAGTPATKLSPLELRLLELIGFPVLGDGTVEDEFSKNTEFEAIDYMVLDVPDDTLDPLDVYTPNLLQPSTSKSINVTVPPASIKFIKLKSPQKRSDRILLSNVTKPPSKCSFKGIPSTSTSFIQVQNTSPVVVRQECAANPPQAEELFQVTGTNLKFTPLKTDESTINTTEYTEAATSCAIDDEIKLEVLMKMGASMERMAVAMERKAKASMRKALAMERIAKVKESQLRLRGRKRK